MSKALEKNPDRRYASAAEMRTDLQNLRRATESGLAAPTVAAAKPAPDSKERIRSFFAAATTALKPQPRVGMAGRLVIAACAATALVVLFLFLRSPQDPPAVISVLQITSDAPRSDL